ncbi:MAG: Epoxide hydrolase, partial [uncultured Rubrobacteraceae bacterium]
AHMDHRVLGRRRDRHFLRALRRGWVETGRTDRRPGDLHGLLEGPRQCTPGVPDALLRRPVLDRRARRRPLRGVGAPVRVRRRRSEGGRPREHL